LAGISLRFSQKQALTALENALAFVFVLETHQTTNAQTVVRSVMFLL
jgi:hypothetical protein